MSSSSSGKPVIILHALYNPGTSGSLCFFGETCEKDQTNLMSNDEPDDNPDHPFAVQIEELISRIGQLTESHEGASKFSILEFPSQGQKVIGSLEWIQNTGTVLACPDSFIYCRTPTVSSSISFFLNIRKNIPELKSHTIPGGSIRYWLRVFDLAAEMVIRGRYLPSIGRYQNGGTCTLWRPAPSSYDKKRIDQLISAMPPNQIRYLQYGTEGSNPVSKQSAVLLFITQIISAIITQSESIRSYNPAASLSPIERLKYAPELTALSFLQGIERHKMPISNPQISNGWKSKYIPWADQSLDLFPDDLPWTVCAKLEEISFIDNYQDSERKNHETWGLVFYIKSADDPRTLIPASDLIINTDQPSVILPEKADVELILREASEKIIRHSSGITIDKISSGIPIILIPESDLIRFLTHDVPKIHEPGLEIIVPEWWGSQNESVEVKLSVRQGVSHQAVSHVGLHQLLTFNYLISIGDDSIGAAEFKQMVEQNTSVARIGKRWVSFDIGKVNQVITGIEKRYRKHSLSLADFLRVVVQSEQTDSDIRIQADDDWTENLINFIRRGTVPDTIPVPSSFIGTLRPYQEAGLTFLSTCRSIGFGACLADDMGLGKTPQTIAYLLACKNEGTLAGPSLLICPTSILGNWERELAKFAPSLMYIVHHGSGRLRGDEFLRKAKDQDLIITSYAIVHRDRDLLSHISYATLILDEVQNIKNAKTKQFQAVRTLQSDHRIALTGTPVENHLIELWAIMEILNPDFLGSYTAFQKNYATPIGKGNAEEKISELRRMIQPFFLRRVKTDTSVINDLPDKMEMPIFCLMTSEQAALYQATLNNLGEEIHSLTGMTRRGRILASITRLKQICNHPDLLNKEPVCEPHRSGKVKRLIEMLEEVRDEGDAAIIFTQYATFAQALAKQIHSCLEREVLVLTGSTPRNKREEMIARFMRHDGPQFFVISLKAGGTGLNLMRATHVFHIDRWWNPAVEDQATDRTYRIGQTRSVQVRQMITVGTLEEQIDEMITRKRALADQIITSGEEWLTELPDGELMNILRLREQVFGDDL